MRSRGRFGVIFLVVGLLVLPATAAFAQYPPPPVLSVSTVPEDPQPGDEVEATVAGAQPGELLSWEAATNPVFASGTVTADAQGEATFAFTVPEDLPIGTRIFVRVSGELSGSADAAVVVSDVAEEEVVEEEVAAEPTPDMPRTGLEVATFVLAALLLIGLGGAAIVGARRRERSRVEA